MENFMNEMAKQSIINQPNQFNHHNNQNKCEILGICYVPMQKWEQIYDEDTAFSIGTLFPSLNLPFLGGGK